MTAPIPIGNCLITITLFIVLFTGCSHRPEVRPENDPALTNTSWLLNTLHNRDVRSIAIELYFDHESNRLSGFTGCNKLTGSFLIGPDKIEMYPSSATRFICFGTGEIEKEFLECLARTDSLIVKNDSLQLGNEGKVRAIFTKKQLISVTN